ncbi:MAG TPA: hypothetical protein VGR05_06275 [Sphingomicrobium sp.]|nr:hypothetical protein [Sphingomicrobium sp.]
MATTKKTTTRRAPRKATSATPTRTTTARPSAATRAGKAIAKRPVASAAIATGLVSGIAAAVAGFFAFKKSGKSFSDFSGDIATSVKDKASETSARVKDGLADAGTKAKDTVSKLRDGLDGEKSQAEIAEEALTLKETGKKGAKPLDPVVEQETSGAVVH